jgi:predicted nucleic acid-binding protein
VLIRAARGGVTGGAVYDALIAATVHHAGGRLLTRDRRAIKVYEEFGIPYELVF